MDRNIILPKQLDRPPPSLSARRAWIEIEARTLVSQTVNVALRKESVDRNPENPMIRVDEVPSLSARRAWIEITQRRDFKRLGLSLSARRAWIEITQCRL